MSRLVLGTRGSRLALAQSETCAETLRKVGFDVEVRVIATTSDHRPDESLAAIDERDVFTRQLDEAITSGEADLAVHSLKDIPTDLPEGISIVAVSDREDPSDALVSEEGHDFETLPEGAVVATSSLRRRAQILNHRHDLAVVGIRGNIDTRIRKMRSGEADAVVLARAGLTRLGLSAFHTVTSVPHDVILPAVGQGALGVAMRGDHQLTGAVRAALNHPPTERATGAERALLKELEGGCRVPVGANAVVLEGGEIHLGGLVASIDGAMIYRAQATGADPEEVGREVARDLLDQGAEVILSEVRGARHG